MNINLTESNFKKVVLESIEPVIIEVTADWCGATSIIEPILQRVMNKYNGAINFCKLDIEKNNKLAKGLGVETVPVLLFYNNALLVYDIRGTFTSNFIEEKIKSILLVTLQ